MPVLPILSLCDESSAIIYKQEDYLEANKVQECVFDALSGVMVCGSLDLVRTVDIIIFINRCLYC